MLCGWKGVDDPPHKALLYAGELKGKWIQRRTHKMGALHCLHGHKVHCTCPTQIAGHLMKPQRQGGGTLLRTCKPSSDTRADTSRRRTGGKSGCHWPGRRPCPGAAESVTTRPVNEKQTQYNQCGQIAAIQIDKHTRTRRIDN